MADEEICAWNGTNKYTATGIVAILPAVELGRHDIGGIALYLNGWRRSG
jgi:hypothetical protein